MAASPTGVNQLELQQAADPNNDSNVLLNACTELLAWLGDEMSQDGYINVTQNNNNNGRPKYKIAFRAEPLSMKQIAKLVPKIKAVIEGPPGTTLNSPVLRRSSRLNRGSNTPTAIPADIVARVNALKTLADSKPALKGELIEYLGDLDFNSGMMGGNKKSKKGVNKKSKKGGNKKSKKTRKVKA